MGRPPQYEYSHFVGLSVSWYIHIESNIAVVYGGLAPPPEHHHPHQPSSFHPHPHSPPRARAAGGSFRSGSFCSETPIDPSPLLDGCSRMARGALLFLLEGVELGSSDGFDAAVRFRFVPVVLVDLLLSSAASDDFTLGGKKVPVISRKHGV